MLLDENKPLFNRAVRAKYPPGSTFKTVQCLVAQQENVANAETSLPCNHALVKCHGHPPADLQRSIQYSCNPYYYQIYRRLIYQQKLIPRDSGFVVASEGDHREGYNIWRKYMDAFNLGRKTGVDLTDELDGDIPDISLYDDRYGRDNWKFSNIYSLGIGQGEVGVLPIQLANVAATIANRGYYYKPHLIKAIGISGDKHSEYKVKHRVPIDQEHFTLLIDGMRDAYRAGTVASFAVIPDIEVCGKTGTAQNPHGEDHSVFIAFAPKDNPKIAIAVHVENAGFGGVWAAPVAALMIEKYLKGKISNEWTENYVLDKKFIEEKAPEIQLPPADSLPQKPANPGNKDSVLTNRKEKIAMRNE